MPFDPFGIQEYHDEIRSRIEAGEPGYAQTYVGDIMVSFEAASFRGPVFAFNPLGFSLYPNNHSLLEELIVDVARQEGMASPRTFRRVRIERMIEDRQAYPAAYPKMRRQAELLQNFYIDGGAEGEKYLF